MESALNKESIRKINEAKGLEQDKTLKEAVAKALDVLLLAVQALVLAAGRPK